MKYHLLCVFFFLVSTQLISQEISGKVLHAKTQEPIEGASVYFNNTTVGTLTNFDGSFILPYKEGFKNELIVSYVGFKKVKLEDYSPQKTYKILMEEEVTSLSEVYLSDKDSWTREQKETAFKTQFLGLSKTAQSCVIENLDQVKLRFIDETGQLVATSKHPIIIRNEKLQYRISYDLKDFTVQYSRRLRMGEDTPRYYFESVAYSGTAYFRDLETPAKNKTLKRRREHYLGSVMHFMRALFKEQLNEEGFRIIEKGLEIAPKYFIKLFETDDAYIKEVRLFKAIAIDYEGRLSVLQCEGDSFTVSYLGNYGPVHTVLFSGDMLFQRVGDMLPFNYYPESD